MLDILRAIIEAHQAGIGLVILGLMFAGFVTERFPATVVAIIGACSFLFLGILDSDGLFSVFSNPAPITIGAMFILSGALLRTGIVDAIAGTIIQRARKRPRMAVVEMMVGVYFASAFMNNTPVVVVMIPIIMRLAAAVQISYKKLLIPLSYVTVLGGTTTLIGTSTNLLVDSVAREAGLKGFTIFSITPIGLAAGLAGMLALGLLGRHLLPGGETASHRLGEEDSGFLTELRLLPQSDYVGRRLSDLPLARRAGLSLVALKRGEIFRRTDIGAEFLQANDVIVARCNLAELLTLRNSPNFELGITAGPGGNSPASARTLVEATIAPTHPSIGKRLSEIPFLNNLDVRILGISRFRKVTGPDLGSARIHAVDRVLVTGPPEQIAEMYANPHLYGVGETREREFRRDKAPVAVGALLAVVLLSTFNVMAIGVAAILAVGVILLTRCIDAEEAWGSLDGNVLLLIFAMLAVGLGLEQAGSVQMVVDSLIPYLKEVPAWGLLIAVYTLAVLLTEIVTNNAVAVIVTPIVIRLAQQLGMDPEPLVVAVMFAASASFATPIGYQTNTIVYAAGGYRFSDFFRAGIPLTLCVGTATCIALYLHG